MNGILRFKYNIKPLYLLRICLFSLSPLALALVGFYAGQPTIGWLLIAAFMYSLYLCVWEFLARMNYAFKIELTETSMELKEMLGYKAVIPRSSSKFIINESSRKVSFGGEISEMVTYQIAVRNKNRNYDIVCVRANNRNYFERHEREQEAYQIMNFLNAYIGKDIH